MTYGEQFKSALRCETKEDATAWMNREITRYKTLYNIEADEARRTILVNLGYMAGYYDSEVARKIDELFGAAHPIFGRNYFQSAEGR